MRRGKYLKDELNPDHQFDDQLALVGDGALAMIGTTDTEALEKQRREQLAIASRYRKPIKFDPNHKSRSLGRVPRPAQPSPANHKMNIPKTETGGNKK